MVLFLWGALSDERTGLSFVYSAGPRQPSFSTVSDSFSSLPTTLRVTVEVLDPASTWVVLFFVTTLHGLNRKHRSQQFLYCCLRIRCRGNLFTEPLSRNGRLLWLQCSGLQASCHIIKHVSVGWFLSVLLNTQPFIPKGSHTASSVYDVRNMTIIHSICA
jgi:hypothetical protein